MYGDASSTEETGLSGEDNIESTDPISINFSNNNFSIAESGTRLRTANKYIFQGLRYEITCSANGNISNSDLVSTSSKQRYIYDKRYISNVSCSGLDGSLKSNFTYNINELVNGTGFCYYYPNKNVYLENLAKRDLTFNITFTEYRAPTILSTTVAGSSFNVELINPNSTEMVCYLIGYNRSDYLDNYAIPGNLEELISTGQATKKAVTISSKSYKTININQLDYCTLYFETRSGLYLINQYYRSNNSMNLRKSITSYAFLKVRNITASGNDRIVTLYNPTQFDITAFYAQNKLTTSANSTSDWGNSKSVFIPSGETTTVVVTDQWGLADKWMGFYYTACLSEAYGFYKKFCTRVSEDVAPYPYSVNFIE